MHFISCYRSVILILFMPLFIACQQQTYKEYTHNPHLYRLTVKKLNDIILENNFSPVTASRNYTYANIAGYEVMAMGDPKHYNSLHGQIGSLGKTPVPASPGLIDFPLASIFAFCRVGNAVTFPEGSMDKYVGEITKTVQKKGIPRAVLSATRAYADTVSLFIINWSHKDNYAQTRSASRYSVTQEKGRWVPTPPMYAQAVEAHWSEIRPLVLDSAGQIKVPTPPHYDMENKSSQFYKNALEVKKTVDHLTAEEKHIADFWDDNSFKLNVIGHVMYATKKFSPIGHWMNIVGIVSQNKHLGFNATIASYTYASLAVFDSFISCWYTKFHTNYVRPETVINQSIDQDWKPYLQTPPFPEYTSGHAVISAAAAEILTSKLGDHITFRDTSESEFGIAPLSFRSLREAASQASRSRVLGGIHFANSCKVGADEGKRIGLLVEKKIHLEKSGVL